MNENTLIPLEDNAFLYKDTTLYCITEKNNVPQVTWTYEDIDEVSTTLYSTTNAITGVSTLYVTNDRAGYYRCEVSQNGGNSRTYTVGTIPTTYVSKGKLLTGYHCMHFLSLLILQINQHSIALTIYLNQGCNRIVEYSFQPNNIWK